MSAATILEAEREWMIVDESEQTDYYDDYDARNARLRATLQSRCNLLNHLNRNGEYFNTPYRVEDLMINLSSNEDITHWTITNNRVIDRINELEEQKQKQMKR